MKILTPLPLTFDTLTDNLHDAYIMGMGGGGKDRGWVAPVISYSPYDMLGSGLFISCLKS